MANFPGTTGPDYYTGTAEADQMDGGDGNDILAGKDGDDVINGGDGYDQIDGGAGSDILHGGEGNDSIRNSDASSSTVTENDQMFGDGGDDSLDLYLTDERAASVLLDGGEGHDRIVFNAWYHLQTVNIVGGNGNDSVDVIGGGTINVDLGAGNDRLSFNFAAHRATYSITLGSGSDLLIVRRSGSGAPDPGSPVRVTDFAAGAGGDRLGFDNYLNVPAGGDWTVNPFAAGYLALVQRGSDAVLRLDYDGGGDGFVDFIVFEGVSAASLTAYNIGYAPDGGATPGISQDGDDSNNYLLGSGGSELLRGFGGYDEIFGGAGADRLEGGAGADHLDGGLGDDVLLGEADDDTLNDWYGGSDQMFGGDGRDNLNIDRGGAQVASTLLLDGGAGYDQLRFMRAFVGGFIDTVTLIGGADGDSISSGGAKISTIDAGDGDDNVYVYNVVYKNLTTAHSITLGAGRDRLVLDGGWLENGVVTVTDFATGGLGDRIDIDYYLRDATTGWDPRTNPYETGHLRLVQRGADSVLQIDRDGTGSARTFTDLIVFSNSSAAAFTTVNLGGYSSVTGSDLDDRLTGDVGRNAIYGLGGNDILIGYEEADTLYGGTGNDRLEGGEGADKLDGGTGLDMMIGGNGNDIYIVDDAGDQVVEEPPYPYGSFYPEHEYDEVQTALAVYTRPDNVERLTGTSNSGQILTGGAGYDMIRGGGGNDYIYLLEGQNSGSGGAGDDRIEGGSGIDGLSGGAGSDILLGFGGNDSLDAGYALPGTPGTGVIDRLEGGEGNDWLRGNRGNDVLLGGIGDDVLEDFEGGADLLDGGDGDDKLSLANYYYYTPVAVRTLLGGAGNDVAQVSILSGETLQIDLGEGDDQLRFTTNLTGAANVTLGSGRDSIEFSDYSPSFQPGSSVTVADFAAGATGDILLLKDFLAAWLTNWDKVTNPFLTGHVRLVQSGGSTLLQLDRDGGGDNFATRIVFANSNAAELRPENLDMLAPTAVFGTGAGDTIRGSSGNDRLDSGDGSDILHLWMGGGDDTVLAGTGNDNIFFGGTLNSADVVNGGDGTDTLVLQGNYAGGLTLSAGVTLIENVSILGGGNTSFGEPGTNRYDYVLTTNDSNFAAGLQARINGSALLAGEDFTFDGSAETNASFVVYGGRCRDTLTGGLGNDIFFYAEERFASGDTVNGGSGYDGMFLRGNYTIDFNAPGYTGLFTNIENLTLTSATDERYARGGGSEFDYNLTLSNAIVNSGQVLTVSGTILMASESMILDGSQEADGFLRLFGGKSGDTLKGGGQADLIHGNLGADILAGNGGADAFRYQAIEESNAATRDQILDFTPGTDKIELDRIDANTLAFGDQAFSWIGSNAFTGTAGQLRAFQQGGTWILEGDVNGDGVADLVIALTLQGPVPLGAGDFLL